MPLHASYKEYLLKFSFPAGTSRGVLQDKKVFYLILEQDGIKGIGECSVIPGLSIDDKPDYQQKVEELCSEINLGIDFREIDLATYPSISFGLETALLDLKAKGRKILFCNNFTLGEYGIPINGLVWMGDKAFMEKQIRQKIDAGFRCIKLKIGAIDFSTEMDILFNIRQKYSSDILEIRLDANGAFDIKDALEKLKRLSDFDIHSIEQPIKAAQWLEMAALCAVSPIPVALDEELIGVYGEEKQTKLLSLVQPDYIILKPGLLGGLEKAQEWIEQAEELQIGWWVTSALESNIGLNAIAQWTSTLETDMPQGLGTGQLFTNNLASPLTVQHNCLYYQPSERWDLSGIQL